MQVMTSHKKIKHGDYIYALIGADEPTHVHINNHKTNSKSIMIPISAISELLEELNK